MSADILDTAIADAQKILGNEGKLPKEKGGINKDLDAESRCRDELGKAIALLKARLVALEKATDAMKDSAQATRNDFDGSNFGLDPKDPKLKKQIADAQKIVFGVIDGYIDRSKVRSKLIEDVYKTVSSMNKQMDQAKGG